MKRIHVIGSGPRTGTTLLTEVIRVCFNIDLACDHEASICQSNSSFGKGKILLTKQPAEINIVGAPLKIDQDLYIICIVRDPRDMVSSFHGAFPNIYWCSLRYWFLFVEYYHKIKNNKRFLIIKYEDFVLKPNDTQNEIAKKIPFLKIENKFSDYHIVAKPNESSTKALKKLRPIEGVGIGNWKKHMPRIKQQLEKHGDISKSLIDFGYENNTKWLHQLVDVEKREFQTKTGEFFSTKELAKRKRKGWIAVGNIILGKLKLNPDLILKPAKNLFRSFKRNQ